MVIPIEVKPVTNIPTLAPGHTVKVHVKVVEGERVRTQIFQGVVIRVRGNGGINSSFMVRRIASGVGVERVFPMHSPLVEKVEIVRKGKVRRAALYYLRGLSGKAARIKERRGELAPEIVAEQTVEEAQAEAPIVEEVVAATEDKTVQESAVLEAQPEAKQEQPVAEAKKTEAQTEQAPPESSAKPG